MKNSANSSQLEFEKEIGGSKLKVLQGEQGLHTGEIMQYAET